MNHECDDFHGAMQLPPHLIFNITCVPVRDRILGEASSGSPNQLDTDSFHSI